MKVKRQNHSVFFRGLVLTFALAMAVLCIPFDCWSALAATVELTDHTYMTIGKVNEDIKNTVVKGGTYKIHNAYIGGNSNVVVGKAEDGTILNDYDGEGDADPEDVVLKDSTVSVSYSSLPLELATAGQEDEVDLIVETPADANYYGYFKAGKVGTYIIKYAYVYEVDGQSYTNSYELKVSSEFSSATINFESNASVFVPKIYDLTLAKKGESYKDLVLPNPVVKNDADKEETVSYEYSTTNKPSSNTGKTVVISVKGGVNSNTVAAASVTEDANGNFVLSGDVFKDTSFGAGKYAVRYTYYVDGNYVTSTTKEFTVYADNESAKYYKDYDLELELASDWVDNGQTGVASKLPKAIGVTAEDSTPSSEAVDVYYKVKVYFKAAGSSESYAPLTSASEGYEEVVGADGYLIDASEFKPLNDGSYAFEYEIFDIYYEAGSDNASTHKKSSGYPVYEFKDIKDETNPTPIIVDASQYVGANADNEKIDESYKLASRSDPNAVVVYAISATDNVTTDGIELSRKIMTDETVSKLEIKDYDEFNLIFNYRNSSTVSARANLTSNNYLIRTATADADVSTETKMLAWLKDNGYRIVVDNANAETIYDIFNEEDFFADKVTATEAEEKKTEAIAWLKSEAALAEGFAYVDVDETFGASSDNKGMGIGQYYIHYIAKDAAGNEKDLSKSMYIGTYVDNDVPEIKFATTLSDSYLPTDKVTFDAPTASDYYDTNMKVRTMYRYLDNAGAAIEVQDEDATVVSNNNLSAVWADLANMTKVDGVELTEKYAAYHAGNNDGYVELTDASASSYTIDLSEAGATAVKLQIVTFVYDDKGNVNFYGETVAISNAIDKNAPKFQALGTVQTTYEQGAEIEIPEFVVLDDAVSYMNFEVKVIHTDSNTEIATYDAVSDRNILSQSGVGSYKVSGGKFVASFAGNYQARIAVKDGSNKTVVTFVNYTVTPRTIIQPPVLKTSLESKTVELDDMTEIALPTPSVSYDIPNSVTYDVFSANKTKYETITTDEYLNTNYVVMGVDQNGKATNPSTTYGDKSKFVPERVGEYPIMYTVNLTVYNYKTFSYVEMDENYEGGYFNFANGNGNDAKVYLQSEDVLKIENSDMATYFVVNSEAGIKVYAEEIVEGGEISDSFTGTALAGVDFEEWFRDLKAYKLTSDVYTIIVKDTKGPKLAEEVYKNYEDTISTEEIEAATGKYQLAINSIQATDASDINIEKSKIVVSWKYVNGSTGSKSYTGADAFKSGIKFEIDGTSEALDATYTITYTVYDNNGNYTTQSKTIVVGDTEGPRVIFPEEFVEDTFKIGQNVTIDLSEVNPTDENEPSDGFVAEVKLVNKSTGEEIDYTEAANVYTFDKFEEVGSYTLTITYKDAKGNETSTDFTIEVSEKTQDSITTYKVVGTVLIVVSVLVLAGVIIYFIVSKVKLDKELKK